MQITKELLPTTDSDHVYQLLNTWRLVKATVGTLAERGIQELAFCHSSQVIRTRVVRNIRATQNHQADSLDFSRGEFIDPTAITFCTAIEAIQAGTRQGLHLNLDTDSRPGGSFTRAEAFVPNVREPKVVTAAIYDTTAIEGFMELMLTTLSPTQRNTLPITTVLEPSQYDRDILNPWLLEPIVRIAQRPNLPHPEIDKALLNFFADECCLVREMLKTLRWSLAERQYAIIKRTKN